MGYVYFLGSFIFASPLNGGQLLKEIFFSIRSKFFAVIPLREDIFEEFIVLVRKQRVTFFSPCVETAENVEFYQYTSSYKKKRIPRNAVSRLPAIFHKIEVNL